MPVDQGVGARVVAQRHLELRSDVGYESAAEKELTRLDKQVARRVARAVSALGAEPCPPGRRRLVGCEGLWRIRIGDHQIVYTIMDSELMVLVLRIAHHSEVYRRV